MKHRSVALCGAGLATAVVIGALLASAPSAGQLAPAPEWEAPRTPWGDPDLRGIWDSKSTTPLERPAEYAGRQFLSDEEIAALEAARERDASQGPQGRDVRAERGSEADVEGAYNNIFSTFLGTPYSRTQRTALIKDPPDGRLPPRTPDAEARVRAAVEARAARRRSDLPYPVDTGRS